MDCHSGACSPVSVVNAWAYLQGAFPNIYTGNKTLIGTTTNQIQTSDLVNTANILGDDYMKWTLQSERTGRYSDRRHNDRNAELPSRLQPGNDHPFHARLLRLECQREHPE